MGCEEPELYQHPPQARHLCDVLRTLAEENAQVIVSTHSPHFVSGESFEDIRVIRKNPTTKCTGVTSVNFDAIANTIATVTGKKPTKPAGTKAKLHQTLHANLNEMFFAQRLILVEGIEDAAYITTHLQLNRQWNDYRRLGCHIIPVGGKSQLIQPLAVANAFNIPTLVICDSDGHKYGPTADQEDKRVATHAPQHRRDNTAILRLCGEPDDNPFPNTTRYADHLVMWHSEIGSIVRDDFGADKYSDMKTAAEQELGQPGDLEKNVLLGLIGLVLNNAHEAGITSEHLSKLCTWIIRTTIPLPKSTIAVPQPQATHA